ncbi:MAG: hypothetical protein ACLT5A_05345, partial [Clostridiaceae bacterium]
FLRSAQQVRRPTEQLQEELQRKNFCKIRIKNVESKKYAVQENEPHVQRILLPRAQIWRLICAILRSAQQTYLNQLA